MANVGVSNVCNLACSSCFARSSMSRARADTPFIALEDFDRRLDLLERWRIDEARLIGGEPTLHPAFPTLIARALDRLPRVVVFTNGCMPERALRALETLAPERCTVLVNMTSDPRDGLPPSVQERRRTTLRRLGPVALAGATIVEPSVDLGWLPPLIREAGCRPAMRIGLAHPDLGGRNDWLHPKRYLQAGAAVVCLAARAARQGVHLELDCGFVRCMFSDEDLALLVELDADVGWRCSPVGDIAVDGEIVHCFPLASRTGVRADPTEDAPTMRSRLADQVAGYRVAGVFRECSGCAFRASGECSGGCLAATIRRFHHEGFHATVPARRSRPRELERTA